ncbi:MAG: hypothetical protein Q9220_001498 [cf. Caloplaca sp. 1 TL-2023]
MSQPSVSLSQQRRTSPSFGQLKKWFRKGAEMPSKTSTTDATHLDQQEQNEFRSGAVRRKPVANNATRPDLVPPRGLQQLPRAVLNDTPSGQGEGGSMSSSSDPSTLTGSLTSTQSHQQRQRGYAKAISRRKPPRLQISSPQPRQSLLDLAAGYADVQNPQRAYAAPQRPSPSPRTTKIKSPLYNPPSVPEAQRYKPDQPVKEVAKGQAKVINSTPSHHKSQKTVVRKMVPPQAPKADNLPSRHQLARETRFEDFMGRDTDNSAIPSLPPLPTTRTAHRLSRPFKEFSKYGAGSRPPAAYRLSRPFKESSEYGGAGSRPTTAGSSSVAALSPTESHAQTWLRYDRHATTASHSASTSSTYPPRSSSRSPPLFPLRRNLNTPPANDSRTSQSFKKYPPCQSCRKQIHPSAAISHNGSYLCATDCSSAIPTQTPQPFAPPPPRPRERRSDIPPFAEYAYLQFPPSPSSPPPPPPSPPSTQPQQHRPRPPSSIYPSTPAARISRPPTLPALSAIGAFSTTRRSGPRRERQRGTVYRAEKEEEIIDAYLYSEKEEEVVSPLSERGWEGRGWGRERGSGVSDVSGMGGRF